MIKRQLEEKLITLAKQFPILVLLGPRQTGKTTLVKNLFKNYTYVSLEELDIRTSAAQDPRQFLNQYPAPAIFDEIQRVPELFSYIQTRVDETNAPGQYILTGSHNYLLQENLSQTLAGRASLQHLLPFSVSEWPTDTLEDRLFSGSYPAVLAGNIHPLDWYPSYIQTYIEKDVRAIKSVSDLATFRKFMCLCAARVGQLINYSEIGMQCGVSYNTIQSWLSILETSYIVTLLRPYHQNFNKQIVKTPKLYFYDTGLLCALLDIDSPKQLNTHYLRGHIFECFIISEIHKQFKHLGREPKLYFWRDKLGREVDLLIHHHGKLRPIEIKSAQTPRDEFAKTLKYWQSLSGDDSVGQVVYAGQHRHHRNTVDFLPWQDFLKELVT